MTTQVKVIHWPLSKSLKFNIFKLLFLKNHKAAWSHISYETSVGCWDENSFICSGSYGQDGFQAHIQKSPSLEPRGKWPWNLVYSIGYSSTTKFVKMMTLGCPWPFLWHDQICFLMLLHGWKLIQHIIIYFQACSNSAYPKVSVTGPMVLWFTRYNISTVALLFTDYDIARGILKFQCTTWEFRASHIQ